MRSPEAVSNYYFGSPKALADKVLFIKRGNRLPEYSKLLDNRETFGNVWEGVTGEYYGTQVSIVATQVGPSMVGDCAYALNKPESVCIYSGTSGGLASELKIGDFFVPTAAVSGDGFSQLYGREFLSPVAADVPLQKVVYDRLREIETPPHSGMSFTTSSVLAEDREGFWNMVPQEAGIIEMGCASFFTACQESQKRGAALFWITDLPRRGKSFFDTVSSFDQQKKQLIYSRLPKLELDILLSL